MGWGLGTGGARAKARASCGADWLGVKIGYQPLRERERERERERTRQRERKRERLRMKERERESEKERETVTFRERIGIHVVDAQWFPLSVAEACAASEGCGEKGVEKKRSTG